MSQSVSERLESLRKELDRLDYFRPEARAQAVILRRRIAMLTEDRRQRPGLPTQARRFK